MYISGENTKVDKQKHVFPKEAEVAIGTRAIDHMRTALQTSITEILILTGSECV